MEFQEGGDDVAAGSVEEGGLAFERGDAVDAPGGVFRLPTITFVLTEECSGA